MIFSKCRRGKQFAILLGFFLCAPAAQAQLSLEVSGDQEPKLASLKGSVTISGNDVPALQKCVATITGNLVEVTVPGKAEGESPVVLRGAIIKSALTKTSFKGYIALNDNPYLAAIDDPEVEELIEVQGGQTVSGHITEIGPTGVKIGDQTIPLSKISRICSPTIFEFACALASEAKPEGESYQASATGMQWQRTTSLAKTKEKSDSGKRCCQFPPLVAPNQKKEGGKRHIHIVIPI